MHQPLGVPDSQIAERPALCIPSGAKPAELPNPLDSSTQRYIRLAVASAMRSSSSDLAGASFPSYSRPAALQAYGRCFSLSAIERLHLQQLRIMLLLMLYPLPAAGAVDGDNRESSSSPPSPNGSPKQLSSQRVPAAGEIRSQWKKWVRCPALLYRPE